MENQYSCVLRPLYARLCADDVQPCASRSADRIAVLEQHWLSRSCDSGSTTDPLSGHTRTIGGRWSRIRTTRNGITTGLRYDELTADFDLLACKRRLCLPPMHALNGCALVKQVTGHHCTSKASSLILTLEDESSIVWELLVSLIFCVSITIFNPLTSIVMLPEPFWSFTVILPASVLSTLVSMDDAGTSLEDSQKQPLQIGKVSSPRSNSIHTEALVGGIRKRPTFWPA